MQPLHRICLSFMLMLCLVCSACTSEIYHGLDERGANEMIVVLEQNGILGDKTPDPNAEQQWIVRVPSQSRVEAWRILRSEGLPRPEPEGFGKVYPTGGLIPTANEERVLLQYATAQELRRGLLTIDGIVDAHINLVLPKKARIRLPNTVQERPRASVVVKQQAALAAGSVITEKEVKDIILGGVEGIDPKHITVLLKAERRSTEPLKKARMLQIGPIAVSPGSKIWLQMTVGLLCAIILGLGAALAFVLLRKREA